MKHSTAFLIATTLISSSAFAATNLSASDGTPVGSSYNSNVGTGATAAPMNDAAMAPAAPASMDAPVKHTATHTAHTTKKHTTGKKHAPSKKSTAHHAKNKTTMKKTTNSDATTSTSTTTAQ